MLKRILLAILLFCLWIQPAQAQDGYKLYLPIITKGGRCELMTDPILRISDGTTIIDLLGPGSGWELSDPYWSPQIAQFKGDGSMVDSGLAEGQMLVHREYSNVVETLNLSVTGIDQGAAIQTIRDLLQLGRQASDYWTESYEYDNVWLEAKPACANSLTGYSRIIKMSIPNLSNIFGQPFFSAYSQPVMEDLTLTIEREPFWRGTPPGDIIGPLYNLIKNPDFELWDFGLSNAQPNSWLNLQNIGITGTNNQQTNAVKFGASALRVNVTNATGAGLAKGVTQIVQNTENATEYTILAWVRSEGVTNGVGRLLVTSSDPVELYRSADQSGWTLYVDKFTTGTLDTVGVNCEILATAAGTSGTVYFDGLMLLKGDWVEEAKNGTLPYLSSSHIVNHYDQAANGIVGDDDINWVDVWNIPGDVDALTRLELTNNTTISDITNIDEKIKTVIIGQRRTANVLRFTSYVDAPGPADATASSNDSFTFTPNQNWQQIFKHSISGADNVSNNAGRYRLLVRVKDTVAGVSTLQLRVKYWIGNPNVNIVTLDAVSVPVADSTWAVVNLTPNKAIIYDIKHQTINPADIGFAIEARRTGGTTSFYLDYAELVPTDGGLLTAEVTPAILPGNMLLIDNTNSQTIAATNRQTQPRKLWQDAVNTLLLAMEVYNGKLYWSGSLTIPGTKVFDGDTITSTGGAGLGLGIGEFIYSMKTYQGALYAGSNTGNIYRYTGTTWQFLALNVVSTAYNMETYNGKLYVLHGNGQIWSYDGTVWALAYAMPGNAFFGDLKVWGGKLYASRGSVSNQIYEYNGAAWGLTGVASITQVLQLEVVDNMLWYAGQTGGEGRVGYYNGSVFTTDTTFPDDSTSPIFAIQNYNEKLFVGCLLNGNQVVVFERGTDGLWSQLGLSDLSQSIGVQEMAVFDGVLYLGTIGDATNFAIVYTISDKANWYSVADYQGSPFTSPPEKRHRWIFEFDRENYVNNIDDAALIGLGFVPRYLSLINYYPQ